MDNLPLSFAFLLKTYPDDYHYAIRLLKTFQRYNKDGLKLFVVGPDDCRKAVYEGINNDLSNIYFLQEKEFPYLQEQWQGLSAGYINQEIIKLSFWEKGLCENYFCLDSDGIFIRDFYFSDFMYDDHIPYTIIFDDMELKSDPLYFERYWKPRELALEKIKSSLGLEGKTLWTCHGFQNFNAKVLQSFANEYMKPHGYSYGDLMRISPYEFSWYNYYLQNSDIIPRHIKGQIFKCFHLPEHYVSSCLLGTQIEDLAKGYTGIILNSNYLSGREVEFGDIHHCRYQVPKKYRGYLLREIFRSAARDWKWKIFRGKG